MRSRFTAFNLQQFQYLIVTYQAKSPLKTSDFDTNLKWLGLKVIATDRGEKSDNQGFVEFVAFYQSSKAEQLGKIEQLHEKSYFEKIDSQWFYISGSPLANIKLVRNEPCFCNSGKKYKKCHGV
jgi:SEC-C motif-containing protein